MIITMSKKILIALVLLNTYLSLSSQNINAQVKARGLFGASASCDGDFTSFSSTCSGNIFVNKAFCNTTYGFASGKCNKKINQNITQSEQQLCSLDDFISYLKMNLANEEMLLKNIQQLRLIILIEDYNKYGAVLQDFEEEIQKLPPQRKKIINDYFASTQI